MPINKKNLATSSSSSKNTNNNNNLNNFDNESNNSIGDVSFNKIEGKKIKRIASKNSAFQTRGIWRKIMKRKKGHASDRIHPKLVKRATVAIVATFTRANPNYHYNFDNKPRRTLTKPDKPGPRVVYDNEHGNLIVRVNDCLSDPSNNREYIVIELLGEGTFGQVFKCSTPSGQNVAVKVIKSTPAYTRQAIEEIKLLTYLSKQIDCKQKHIVSLLDHFECLGHRCLVFEMLSMNLYELIRENRFKGLSINTIQVFLRNLLDSLAELERLRIIHCDLKPENVLLENYAVTPAIKLIDFGSACFENHTVFSYIQSRFYRSPEVLLEAGYGLPIDMWSLGCICAELFLGLPLFPGKDHYDQIAKIVEMLGIPPNSLLDNSKLALKFFNCQFDGVSNIYTLKTKEEYYANKPIPRAREYWDYKDIERLVHAVPMDDSLDAEEVEKEKRDRNILIHFIMGLLRYDPNERWTAYQAKQHPLITGQKWTGEWSPPADPYQSQAQSIPMAPYIHPGSGSRLSPFVTSSYGSLDFPATPPSLGQGSQNSLIPNNLSVGKSPSMSHNTPPYMGSSLPHSRSGSFTYSNSPQTQPMPHPSMFQGYPMGPPAPPPPPSHQSQPPPQQPHQQPPQPEQQPQQQSSAVPSSNVSRSYTEEEMMFDMNDDENDEYNSGVYSVDTEQQQATHQLSNLSLNDGQSLFTRDGFPQASSFGSSHISAYGLSPVDPSFTPSFMPAPQHGYNQSYHHHPHHHHHHQGQPPMLHGQQQQQQQQPYHHHHHHHHQQQHIPNASTNQNLSSTNGRNSHHSNDKNNRNRSFSSQRRGNGSNRFGGTNNRYSNNRGGHHAANKNKSRHPRHHNNNHQ